MSSAWTPAGRSINFCSWSQPNLAPFSGLDEGLCSSKADHSVRRTRDGRVPFCSPPVFPLHGGERACGDPWERRSAKASSPTPVARSGRQLSKPGIPQWVVQHETQMTHAVFARRRPSAGGARRSHAGRPLWHRAAAV